MGLMPFFRNFARVERYRLEGLPLGDFWQTLCKGTKRGNYRNFKYLVIIKYLTNDKLVIVGAGGMIGSNMAQSVLMLGLTPNVCLYDIYEPGVHGVFDEIQQCAFPGANVTYYAPAVEDMGNPEKVAEAAKKAFTGAKYIISSGGAPRKAGMTREDLLKGNCKIAADFGDNIKKYCPDVEHVVVIFNPADVTALTTLIHSGLKPNQLTSLAALDSTRLQQALAHEFGV